MCVCASLSVCLRRVPRMTSEAGRGLCAVTNQWAIFLSLPGSVWGVGLGGGVAWNYTTGKWRGSCACSGRWVAVDHI